MKNVVRILCVALVVTMAVISLVSCGAVPSGTYVIEGGDVNLTQTYTQYKFSGSKFEYTSYLLGKKVEATSYSGKYKVEDGEITFTWKDSDGETQTKTVTYAKNEDGSLKIGLLTYKKQ